ncbi:alpha-crystallin B chain-like [Contarinia nasturtii]|uniref:alpha-crystallin B chain-like n=1 Tax=Contarinia nasturtii TaxID=265458 RepID=UPI0012D3BC69|nr:alpha-crystallin B chain-like [Contarinia nasturtii]
MALVPYERRIAEYKDWLEAKRRWNDDLLVSEWFWPTPQSWSAYRSLCTPGGYLRPWVDSYYGDLNCVERDVKVTKDLFQVQLDVRHFKSYEIQVKVVGNSIKITGKHDKRPKVNGYIERQFERTYDLSNDFRIRDVTSSLSTDGILTVKAYPTVPPPSLAYVRNIPTYQTFRPSYLEN